MPKTERCPGSEDFVLGPDEPDGTVQCFKCGRSFLRMERRVVDGKTQLFVAEHRRPVQKVTKRRAKKTKARRSTRRASSRGSSRR
jgi:hypothetical protein